jgi:hypothetical protein
MKTRLIAALLACGLGLGIVAMTGCGSEKKSDDASKLAPLLLLNQQGYFPEIPKGVAE